MMSRMQALSKLIKTRGWAKGVELGVARGNTFFYLLKKHPELTLIGVDSFVESRGHGDKATTGFRKYGKEEQQKRKKAFCDRVVNEFYGRGFFITESSLVAAEEIDDGSLDFVFIDADHRASFVRADIAAWLPKLKKGGYLLGHDWKMPSVRKALDAMIPGYELIESVWSIQKEKVCFR